MNNNIALILTVIMTLIATHFVNTMPPHVRAAPPEKKFQTTMHISPNSLLSDSSSPEFQQEMPMITGKGIQKEELGVDLSSGVEFFEELEYGSGEFLTVREEAIARLPDKWPVYRFRVVKVNFARFESLIFAIENGQEVASKGFLVKLFEDKYCAISTAKILESESGNYLVQATCGDCGLQGMSLTIRCDLSRIDIRFEDEDSIYFMNTYGRDYGLIYETKMKDISYYRD